MHPSLIRLARLFAWTAALGAGVVLALGYNLLPAEFPVTRWATEPKTPLLVFRIPAINLLTVLLVEILERILVRAHGASAFREHAMRVVAILYATAGLKATLEGMELLLVAEQIVWIAPVLGIVVVLGLVTAGWIGRPFLAGARNSGRALGWTRTEGTVAAIAIAAIIVLQFLPLFS